jgi:hypothetical protein
MITQIGFRCTEEHEVKALSKTETITWRHFELMVDSCIGRLKRHTADLMAGLIPLVRLLDVWPPSFHLYTSRTTR